MHIFDIGSEFFDPLGKLTITAGSNIYFRTWYQYVRSYTSKSCKIEENWS